MTGGGSVDGDGDAASDARDDCDEDADAGERRWHGGGRMIWAAGASAAAAASGGGGGGSVAAATTVGNTTRGAGAQGWRSLQRTGAASGRSGGGGGGGGRDTLSLLGSSGDDDGDEDDIRSGGGSVSVGGHDETAMQRVSSASPGRWSMAVGAAQGLGGKGRGARVVFSSRGLSRESDFPSFLLLLFPDAAAACGGRPGRGGRAAKAFCEQRVRCARSGARVACVSGRFARFCLLKGGASSFGVGGKDAGDAEQPLLQMPRRIFTA
jgi:hypothetical protein